MRKLTSRLCIFFLPLAFYSCHHKGQQEKEEAVKLSNIQIIDRNGFNETITQDDRIRRYQNTDFTEPQPYHKVVRTFKKDREGKVRGCVTAYHENGQIYQYLELVNGRAHGVFKEWHPNGSIRIEAKVIEGIGDFTLKSQETWVFDGESTVYDEDGALSARIEYEKGMLVGNAEYYYPSGQVFRVIPYIKNEIHGEVKQYNEDGSNLASTWYENDAPHGKSCFEGSEESPGYRELFSKGLLMEGTYFDKEGKIDSTVEDGEGFKTIYQKGRRYKRVEIQKGRPQGMVYFYYEHGEVKNSYPLLDGEKHGEEWIYYPDAKPKLMVSWYQGRIHGLTRSWYKNGQLGSEREMCNNKKQGSSLAWYADGHPMLIEEYDEDRLVRGKYLKMGESDPVSKVIRGNGIATIYDENGIFLRKVEYRHGKAVGLEKSS